MCRATLPSPPPISLLASRSTFEKTQEIENSNPTNLFCLRILEDLVAPPAAAQWQCPALFMVTKTLLSLHCIMENFKQFQSSLFVRVAFNSPGRPVVSQRPSIVSARLFAVVLRLTVRAKLQTEQKGLFDTASGFKAFNPTETSFVCSIK